MKIQKADSIIGIDYSLNSPAICVVDKENTFDFNKCQFYFLTNKKKYIGKMRHNIIGDEIQEYTSPIHRFANISDWVCNILSKTINHKIFIEGYSYGSKGQAVFQIAENCGILKYRLSLLHNIEYDTVVPSVVKKYASGKGNADKELMYQTLKKETKVDLMKDFDQQNLNNPVTDIVDAYYIAKVGYENRSN